LARRFLNFDLRLSPGLAVQVTQSPVGEQPKPEVAALPADCAAQCEALERRQLDAAGMLRLGWQLGDALLPPLARRYFQNALARLQPDEGLRIRLSCEDELLDALPWELACAEPELDATREQLGSRAYLCLMPRVSFTRRVQGSRLRSAGAAGPRRLIALVCEPSDWRDPARPLQIEQELQQLREALQGVPELSLQVCEPPTQARLSELMLQGGEVFHFAGHGVFDAQGAALLLQEPTGESRRIAVDDLALRLAERGIRLALLGACQSARVDGRNGWSGIAPSLVRAGIPTVVGMQYTVFDLSALAFAKRFYQGWALNLPLDEVVQEARRAMQDVSSQTGRDFATPVLYVGTESETAPVATKPRLEPFVELLADVAAYKDVHDVLHGVSVQEFPQLELQREGFPGDARTLSAFRLHAAELRRKQRKLADVAQQGRCDAALMQQILDEFAAALDSLERALRERSPDELDAALFGFESLLASSLGKVDHRMCELALARMAEFVAELPLPKAAAEPALQELHALSAQLRHAANVHNQCQSLDRDLKLFLKTRALRPFKTTQPIWRGLLQRLEQEVAGWAESAGVQDLRDAQQRFESAMAADDDEAARIAFTELCDHFGYGFFTVDIDFKQLCAVLKQRAEAQHV
jgi:CHAT domain